MKVKVYRGFKSINWFNKFVGQYRGNVKDLLDNSEYNVRYVPVFMLKRIQLDASFVLTDKEGNPMALKMKIALSLVSTSSATSLNSGNLSPQNNPYQATGGLPAVVDDPKTRAQQAKAVGSVVYEGLKRVLQGINDCSDMCPPLKTATGVFLTIIGIVEVCAFGLLVYNDNNVLVRIRPCWRIRKN